MAILVVVHNFVCVDFGAEINVGKSGFPLPYTPPQRVLGFLYLLCYA